jgi:hypothetical protein
LSERRVRQAKLGASCGMKVPAETRTSHPLVSSVGTMKEGANRMT